MSKDLRFQGFEKDLKSALNKHGFICRNEKSDQYLCFYKIDDYNFELGFLNESEIEELVTLKSWINENERNNFLKYCGQKLDKFLELPFRHKAYSMIQFFGFEDIMGKTIQPLTYHDVLTMIEQE